MGGKKKDVLVWLGAAGESFRIARPPASELLSGTTGGTKKFRIGKLRELIEEELNTARHWDFTRKRFIPKSLLVLSCDKDGHDLFGHPLSDDDSVDDAGNEVRVTVRAPEAQRVLIKAGAGDDEVVEGGSAASSGGAAAGASETPEEKDRQFLRAVQLLRACKTEDEALEIIYCLDDEQLNRTLQQRWTYLDSDGEKGWEDAREVWGWGAEELPEVECDSGSDCEKPSAQNTQGKYLGRRKAYYFRTWGEDLLHVFVRSGKWNVCEAILLNGARFDHFNSKPCQQRTIVHTLVSVLVKPPRLRMDRSKGLDFLGNLLLQPDLQAHR